LLSPGTSIGPYEIVGKLGAGGMGEVYRARDTALGRDVAIKVLPEIAGGISREDRLARFDREAQTLASLNHPRIAQVYGIVELPNGGRGLVMEFVDGQTLAERLAHGAIPLDDAVEMAGQIADALEAAHEHGIVHRDLKPANVMVTPEGSVKVLDFGLAKAIAPSGTSAAAAIESPTFTAHMTQFGVIVGTAAYMAPEQARGKAVDRRADIWAFGVLLYEMVTGRRAFAGDEMSDVLAAVLRQDIDWSALPPATPPRLRQLLERCLERDPKSRLRDIGEARVALAKIASGAPDSSSSGITAAPGVPPARARWRTSMVPAALAATAGILLTVAVLHPWSNAATEPPLARVSLLAPPGADLYPDSTGVAVSPDGTMVAFVVGGVTRSGSQLWVRSLSSMTAQRLEDGDGISLPFWSPDSRRIGFFTATKLRTIAASGGSSEIVCAATGGRGATWNKGNVIVFAPDATGPLYRVPAGGGTPTPITALDTSKKEYGHRFPAFLPDGDHFIYAALPSHEGRFEIYGGSLSAGPASRTSIGSMESAPAYANPGWLLYERQGVLVAQHFDPLSLKITGDPIPMGDAPAMVLDPAVSFTAAQPVSVSSVGSLAYYSSPSVDTVAEWYDAQGHQVGTLDIPEGHYETVVISPDGTHAVLVRSTSPSESALWLVDLNRGSAVPLSSGPGRNDSPVWSPDGTKVAFSADREGAANVWVKTVGDARPEQPLFRSDVLFKNPAAWSPDGAWIAMSQLDPVTAQNIWLLPTSGGNLKPFYAGPTRENAGPISPDGKWMAYLSDQTGRYEIYVQAFPSGGHTAQVSNGGGGLAWWTPDARQLVYLDDQMRTLWRVDVESGGSLSLGTPIKMASLPSIVSMSAMPDRQKFLALAPERVGVGSITIVQNWRAALTER
jgi:serine/threonine protein kinase/Tol biopolymer transport system component